MLVKIGRKKETLHTAGGNKTGTAVMEESIMVP